MHAVLSYDVCVVLSFVTLTANFPLHSQLKSSLMTETMKTLCNCVW